MVKDVYDRADIVYVSRDPSLGVLNAPAMGVLKEQENAVRAAPCQLCSTLLLTRTRATDRAPRIVVQLPGYRHVWERV